MSGKWFRISLFALLGVTMVVMSSCGTDGTPALELQTPTGCWKSSGRYFDPKVGQCVAVTDQHQALVLNAFRYVNQLAEKDAGVNEYRIYPKRFLTTDETEVLWADLRDHGTKMIVLGGTLPDDRVYDPEEQWDLQWQQNHSGTPRVWGGPGSTSTCGWWQREDAASDTVLGMLDEDLKRLEKERPRPQLRKAVLDDGDCRFDQLDVLVDAKVIRDWVNRHLEDIEGVQPIVSVLDENMPQLGPLNALKEGT